MTAEEVFKEPSDKEKILDFLLQLEAEHPYKVPGKFETYSDYNQAWTDCCNTLENFIENL